MTDLSNSKLRNGFLNAKLTKSHLSLSLLGNYHFLLSSLIFDFIIQNGHQTPELFAVNITGVKVLDLDFLNETQYSLSSSPVTILESNGSNRLSKNVTARKLSQEEIDQLTSVLLAWSKVSQAASGDSAASSSRPNGAHSSNGHSQVHRSQANSPPINNSKASGRNIQDISVMIAPLISV